MKQSIVFFGTPPFAASLLRFLHEHKISIDAIVTQPDKERGRSLQVLPSAVKALALELGLKCPIFQPEKASEESFLHLLEKLGTPLYVVVAYGQILTQRLLSIPSKGCINVHASLLPKYRGAAPIQRALLAGDEESGVCIQKMVRKMDAGDVIATAKVIIPPEMTFGELEAALCETSKNLLLGVLAAYEKGIPSASSQEENLVTFAPKIEPQETEIQWTNPAKIIHNQIRAFSPRPGAWSWLEKDKRRIKILRTRVVPGAGAPGMILSKEGLVACGEGALELLEVIPEGKRAMAGKDWLRGMPSVWTHFPKHR